MNNAKMWLVVKPTVGVPLFLSAVALGSFAVHVAVLINTTWVADFLSGKPLGAGMAAATTEAVVPHVASYVPQGAQEVLVTEAVALKNPEAARRALRLNISAARNKVKPMSGINSHLKPYNTRSSVPNDIPEEHDLPRF